MKSIRKHKKIILIVVGIIILLPLVYTSAKYVVETIQESYFNSKEFYFDSNTLNGTTYELHNWDGNSNYTFSVDVNNYKDELNFTKQNISYEIELSCKFGSIDLNCYADALNTITANNENYVVNTNTITIEKGTNNFITGDKIDVTVTARSTSPYSKSVSADFDIFINKIGLTYEIRDEENHEFLELIISNNLANKEVVIEFDESLINIDNTNYFVINGTTTTTTVNGETLINSLSFDSVIGNVYSIRFYKNNINANYSLDSEVITVR